MGHLNIPHSMNAALESINTVQNRIKDLIINY